MNRYSDTTRCPDCGLLLPPAPGSCPSCGLPLTGPLVVELVTTLTRADSILSRLRASAPVAVPAGAPLTGSPTADLEPCPVPLPRTVSRERRGLSAASVPTILLGLGALCLLVAAITFLAFAWSWLGIGGRTAVLVTLTLAAGGTGTWLASRGLRIAAESLTVVAFGLLTLDVIGADDAGWLGELSGSSLVVVVGLALTASALGLAVGLRPPLTTPQVVAAAGLTVIASGTLGLASSLDAVVALTVVAHLALTAVGRLRSLRVLPVVALVGGGTWWLVLTLNGLARAGAHATVRELWIDGHAWPLVVASLLLLTPLALRRTQPGVALAGVALAGAGGAAVLVTVTLALPALDESGTSVSVAVLVALVVWSAALVTVPRAWAVVPAAPLILVAVPAAAIALGMAFTGALSALSVAEPFGARLGVRVGGADAFADPALLVPLVLATLVAAVALSRWWHEPLAVARVHAPALLALVGLAGVATLTLYAVPLAAVVAGLTVVAAGLVSVALPRATVSGTAYSVAGLGLALAATTTALPSALLTTLTLAALVAGGVVVALHGRFPFALVGAESLLPATVAALIWSAAEVASVDPALRAAPVLLVVTGVAIVWPRPAVEVSAWCAAVVAACVAVPEADASTWVALHLTLAGALVTASSLVHPSRRLLGWPGGLLLAAATWVRLADLGVDEPEAYTLPTAVALLAVGLRHLWRSPIAVTRVALGPGLTLAAVPSLLVVLVGDPVSLRAALLGLGCLTMVLAGTRLHWSAPVAVGATVGGLLVLRELAPYASETPQWVLIGLAGTLLTLVGVTWESRLADLHRSTTYLSRLR